MDLDDFVKGFAEQFDDTDPEEIEAATVFRELDEWSSLVGMAIMAYVKAELGKTIDAKELKACSTVEDVYNLVNNKS